MIREGKAEIPQEWYDELGWLIKEDCKEPKKNSKSRLLDEKIRELGLK